MDKDTFNIKFKNWYDTLGDFLDAYEKNNPEWVRITISLLIYDNILNLKRLIESPKEKNINWDNPFVELQYPIEVNWEELTPLIFKVTNKDLEDKEKQAELFARAFQKTKELFIFRHLTKEVLTLIRGDKYFYKLPVEIDNKLTGLSKEEKNKKLDRLMTSISKPIKINLIDKEFKDEKGQNRRVKTSLSVQFNPCVINEDKHTGYYPIVIGLDIKGHKSSRLKYWPKKTRGLFWRQTLKAFKAAFPKEVFDFAGPILESFIKPVSKEAVLVKAGLHTELQKFGKRPPSYQQGLFEDLTGKDIQKEITEKSIDVRGINITQAQNLALFAIQKLFDQTDYKGNIPGYEGDITAFKFRGHLPALEFTPAEYLKAYGVTKRITKRGKEEFSSGGREQALRALMDLASKSVLFVYKRKYWIENSKGHREERIDRIETISPLIKIMRGWKALTGKEDNLLDKGKTTSTTDEKLKIAIEPSPPLVQDINTYFVLKSASYQQEIKLLVGSRASKYLYLFIDYLIAQAELKRRNRQPLIIKENYEEIAYHLRMNSYITTRQYKRIRQILNKSYKIAKELGYLLEYETIQGQTKELEKLVLNPEKFGRISRK